MTSIENRFAGGIAQISQGFDRSILSQASRINALQQNGARALGTAPSAEQLVRAARQSPALARRMVEAMQQDPALLAKGLRALQQNPKLFGMLPPQMRRFFVSVLRPPL